MFLCTDKTRDLSPLLLTAPELDNYSYFASALRFKLCIANSLPLFAASFPIFSKQSIAWVKWEWLRESLSGQVHKCGFRSSLELLLHCHGKKVSKETAIWILRDERQQQLHVQKKKKKRNREKERMWGNSELQTTGSSGQRQEQALLGKYKQGLNNKAKVKVSEKFQVLKDWENGENPTKHKKNKIPCTD